MNKRQRIVVTSLEKQGAIIRPIKSGGVMVRFPDGSSMVMHSSESDHRAEKNTRARVLRAGLTWPFDKR